MVSILILFPACVTIVALKYFHFSLPLASLVAALVSQFTVVDFDLGPASVRVYLVFGLIYLIFMHQTLAPERLVRTKEAYRLCLAYIAFILWTILNRYYNGETVSSILMLVLSTHVLSLSVFIVTQFFVRTRRDAITLAFLITGTSLVSGFVGIMQWLGIQWFWNLARMLHPHETTRELLLGTLFGSWGFVPGLAQYSIPFSYHIITFGMLTFSWVYYLSGKTRKVWMFMLGSLLIVILSLSILISQSRSAVYGSALAMVFIIIYSRRVTLTEDGNFFQKRIQFLPLVIFLVLLLAVGNVLITSTVVQYTDLSAGEGHYPLLTRIFNISDQSRRNVALNSLQAIRSHLFWGGGLQSLEQFSIGLERDIAPHNMFLNAAVYYGIPGLLLFVYLLYTVYHTCRVALHTIRAHYDLEWVVLGAIAGILTYNLNGFFHNDSFVTGGSLGWWLLGLLCGIIAQTDPQQVREKLYATRHITENQRHYVRI